MLLENEQGCTLIVLLSSQLALFVNFLLLATWYVLNYVTLSLEPENQKSAPVSLTLSLTDSQGRPEPNMPELYENNRA